MEVKGGIVQFHGEDPDPKTEGEDKEMSFIEKILSHIRREFPELKISLEHISTEDAVDWTYDQDVKNTVASIAIHHLMNTIDDLTGYSERSKELMCVHDGFKPQAKRRRDRDALRRAVFSGDRRFLYGGDDAAHLRHFAKECLRASCGTWNTVPALPLLVELLKNNGALNQLEPFTSEHLADFYGYPHNEGTVKLVREEWEVPEEYPVPGTSDGVVPFWFGEKLHWRVAID